MLTFSCACWESAGVDEKVLAVVEQAHSCGVISSFVLIRRVEESVRPRVPKPAAVAAVPYDTKSHENRTK